MRKFVLLFIFAAAVALAAETTAGTDNPASSADISAFSILVGHWVGEGFGGVCEEAWHAPSANTMIGTFKLIHGNKLTMFEAQMIFQDSTGWALGVKHFGPDMVGWEEKADYERFAFVSASDTELNFEGLSYKRVGSDSLHIMISVSSKEGVRQEVLKLKRKPE